jgi:hypothetical protein
MKSLLATQHLIHVDQSVLWFRPFVFTSHARHRLSDWNSGCHSTQNVHVSFRPQQRLCEAHIACLLMWSSGDKAGNNLKATKKLGYINIIHIERWGVSYFCFVSDGFPFKSRLIGRPKSRVIISSSNESVVYHGHFLTLPWQWFHNYSVCDLQPVCRGRLVCHFMVSGVPRIFVKKLYTCRVKFIIIIIIIIIIIVVVVIM